MITRADVDAVGNVETVEERNIRLVRRFQQEVWNERREETMDELFHPDVVAFGVEDGPVNGEGFRRSWRAVLSTFSELEFVLEDVIAMGDKTSIRYSFSGIHTGYGLGIPPTGSRVSGNGQTMTLWREGKILIGWNVLDMAAIYRQLGARIS